METLWTIVLGAIQGATEFLPVSSSGHLAFSKMVLALGNKKAALLDQPLILEILLHLATLCAVVLFYRKDVVSVVKGALQGASALYRRELLASSKKNDGMNLAVAIIIGTLPTAIIGLIIKDYAEFVSHSSIGLGTSFLFCSMLLFVSRFFTEKNKRLTWKIALIIGVAQGIAVFPGISRSGTTIVVALALGIKIEEAARFSFLLSIPAILGAAVLELDLDALCQGQSYTPIILSAIAAFVIGYLALLGLIGVLKKGRLWMFAPYMAVMGIGSIIIL